MKFFPLKIKNSNIGSRCPRAKPFLFFLKIPIFTKLRIRVSKQLNYSTYYCSL